MPYIRPDARVAVETGAKIETPGELNYAITCLVRDYLGDKLSYQKINDAIGALGCAQMEVYRRIAAPYEDKKIQENGDVF